MRQFRILLYSDHSISIFHHFSMKTLFNCSISKIISTVKHFECTSYIWYVVEKWNEWLFMWISTRLLTYRVCRLLLIVADGDIVVVFFLPRTEQAERTSHTTQCTINKAVRDTTTSKTLCRMETSKFKCLYIP